MTGSHPHQRWERAGVVVAFAAMGLVLVLPRWWVLLVAVSFGGWCVLLASHIVGRLAYQPPDGRKRGFEVKPITGADARAETKEEDDHG